MEVLGVRDILEIRFELKITDKIKNKEIELTIKNYEVEKRNKENEVAKRKANSIKNKF